MVFHLLRAYHTLLHPDRSGIWMSFQGTSLGNTAHSGLCSKSMTLKPRIQIIEFTEREWQASTKYPLLCNVKMSSDVLLQDVSSVALRCRRHTGERWPDGGYSGPGEAWHQQRAGNGRAWPGEKTPTRFKDSQVMKGKGLGKSGWWQTFHFRCEYQTQCEYLSKYQIWALRKSRSLSIKICQLLILTGSLIFVALPSITSNALFLCRISHVCFTLCT